MRGFVILMPQNAAARWEVVKLKSFMTIEQQTVTAARIQGLIRIVRGLRVMLDADVAVIYGVELKRLREQVRRNLNRFPGSFAFQLTAQEFAALQPNYRKPRTHGGARTAPWVFTEYGALQLAGVLNSPAAVAASIRIAEVFISMREQLAAHRELAAKLAELEGRVAGQDKAIRHLFEAIRQLVEPPPEPHREIGFHVREGRTPYRVKTHSRN